MSSSPSSNCPCWHTGFWVWGVVLLDSTSTYTCLARHLDLHLEDVLGPRKGTVPEGGGGRTATTGHERGRKWLMPTWARAAPHGRSLTPSSRLILPWLRFLCPPPGDRRRSGTPHCFLTASPPSPRPSSGGWGIQPAHLISWVSSAFARIDCQASSAGESLWSRQPWTLRYRTCLGGIAGGTCHSWVLSLTHPTCLQGRFPA